MWAGPGETQHGLSQFVGDVGPTPNQPKHGMARPALKPVRPNLHP